MNQELQASESKEAKPRGLLQRSLRVLLFAMLAYFAVAYLLLPFVWETFEHQRPSLDGVPRVSRTSDGHPGDPLNVALVGSESKMQAAMRAAKWYPASALGLRSDFEIAADTVLKRPDDQAPVSNLYLFGRKEDLAFEQPVGDSPRRRHHVRFWRVPDVSDEGRAVWIGSASYDRGVGLSHTTGQITHHIAADVDAERYHVMESLAEADALTETYWVDGFHAEKEGRNGGGDRWYTDGRLVVGELVADEAGAEMDQRN